MLQQSTKLTWTVLGDMSLKVAQNVSEIFIRNLPENSDENFLTKKKKPIKCFPMGPSLQKRGVASCTQFLVDYPGLAITSGLKELAVHNVS